MNGLLDCIGTQLAFKKQEHVASLFVRPGNRTSSQQQVKRGEGWKGKKRRETKSPPPAPHRNKHTKHIFNSAFASRRHSGAEAEPNVSHGARSPDPLLRPSGSSPENPRIHNWRARTRPGSSMTSGAGPGASELVSELKARLPDFAVRAEYLHSEH